MECNEAQRDATSRNNRAKKIVLSTKMALVVGSESRSQLFFAKKSPILKPYHKRPSILYMNVYECLILKNKDNARKNFII